MSNYIARGDTNTLNVIPPPLSNISALLYSNSGLVPLSNRKYTLQLEKGEILEGATDEKGYLQHLDVPSGDYTLVIDDVISVVPTVADPDERLPIRVRGYYLAVGTDEEDEEGYDDHDEEDYDENEEDLEDIEGEWEDLEDIEDE